MDLRERVLVKLDKMNQFMSELEELLPEEEEYLQSIALRRACEKTIELAIEEVIGIISMIVSQKKLGLPQSEDDLIDTAIKKRVLSLKLVERIRQMKGFRNILVHRYGDLDDQRAYIFLTENRTDFALFEAEIKKFLRKEK